MGVLLGVLLGWLVHRLSPGLLHTSLILLGLAGFLGCSPSVVMAQSVRTGRNTQLGIGVLDSSIY